MDRLQPHHTLPYLQRSMLVRRTLPPGCASIQTRLRREAKLPRKATMSEKLTTLMVLNRGSMELLAKPEPASRKLLPRLEKVGTLGVSQQRRESWSLPQHKRLRSLEVTTQCACSDFPLSPIAGQTELEVEEEYATVGI